MSEITAEEHQQTLIKLSEIIKAKVKILKFPELID